MTKICMIGHFGKNKDFYDGQTVSTRLFRDEIKKRANVKILEIDTYNNRKRSIPILAKFFYCMFTCSHIVVMLSENGLKIFLPLIYYSNKIFRKKIFHRVIGGCIDSSIDRHSKWQKYLKSFEVNWVQSNVIVQKLKKRGILNARYLSNFRNITPISADLKRVNFIEPFPFCTFSRVSESKGIGLAIEAIRTINNLYGKTVATLDVYGPIEDDYKDKFERLLEDNKLTVSYKGSVQSQEAIKHLSKYYFLLFPTTWEGEGFPGAVIDCYNAGLPIIASSWAYNNEVIFEGRTGLIYDWRRPEDLVKLIKKSMSLGEEYQWYVNNCFEEAQKCSCDKVMQQIISEMNIS